MTKKNRYTKIIEKIFFSHIENGMTEVQFSREELEKVAAKLRIRLPKNLGDIIYSFRYRAALPKKIQDCAPEGKVWIIRPAGRSYYKFVATTEIPIVPNKMMAETKIADATPSLVSKYAMDDEQGLLAKVRYNRLIDIFLGLTCYSLQNHLRTTVPDIGQIETDELYIGVDEKGVHYIIPVQAKGGTDRLSIVQIEQDFALCTHRFPHLICKPIAAQFIGGNLIALFVFEESTEGLKIASERHYRLVPPEEISIEELEIYKTR